MSYLTIFILFFVVCFSNISSGADTSKGPLPKVKQAKTKPVTAKKLVIFSANKLERDPKAKKCLEGFGQRIDNTLRTSATMLNISLLRMIKSDWEKKGNEIDKKSLEEVSLALNEQILGLAPTKSLEHPYVLDNENIDALEKIVGSPKLLEKPLPELILDKNKISLYCSVKNDYYNTQFELDRSDKKCGEHQSVRALLKKLKQKSLDPKESTTNFDALKSKLEQLVPKFDALVVSRFNKISTVLNSDAPLDKKRAEVTKLLQDDTLLREIAESLKERLLRKGLYSEICRNTILKSDDKNYKAKVDAVICRSKVEVKIPDYIKKITDVIAPTVAVTPTPPPPKEAPPVEAKKDTEPEVKPVTETKTTPAQPQAEETQKGQVEIGCVPVKDKDEVKCVVTKPEKRDGVTITWQRVELDGDFEKKEDIKEVGKGESLTFTKHRCNPFSVRATAEGYTASEKTDIESLGELDCDEENDDDSDRRRRPPPSSGNMVMPPPMPPNLPPPQRYMITIRGAY